MRLAVFSDIHGNIVGLKAVFDYIQKHEPVDYYYALGDFLAIGPGTEDVIELLVAHNVRMIRGNWDEVFLGVDDYLQKTPEHLRPIVQAHYEWLAHHLSSASQRLLAALPLHDELSIDNNHRIFFCHAAPNNAWSTTCSAQTKTEILQAVYGPIQADLIMYGHYHAHHVIPLEQKILVNVASIGMNTTHMSAFTIIEYNDNRYMIRQYQVPYDREEFERLSKERNVPITSK